MNANEIKSQHPDVYADIVKAGAEQEKARINALMTFIDVDKDTVVKAIAEGKSIHDDEILAKLTMAKINQNTVAQMEKENPTDVNPKEPEHAKEGEGETETDCTTNIEASGKLSYKAKVSYPDLSAFQKN